MDTPSPLSGESMRLAALRRYDILDTPAETEFDDCARLAAQICDTPIALISLVDAERVWFKSKIGFEPNEMPRHQSFCQHAIHAQGLFTISNALKDERFRNHPMVSGAPGIRFYAGAPLTTPDGHAIGALCVKDTVRRRLNPAQREALLRLGRQVIAQMQWRAAKRLLAQQNAFQQALFTGASSTIIATGLDGTITSVSPAARPMLGYFADELIGQKSLAAFHDPKELAARAADLSRTLGQPIPPDFEAVAAQARRGAAETREWTYVRKDGARFPVSLTVNAIRDETGRLTGFLGIARDLGQRKQVETERDLFFDRALDLLCVAGSDGYLKRVNPAFTELLGWSRKELLSRPFLDIVHPDDRATTMQVVAGQKVPTFENRCQHKNGSWRVLSWTSAPLPDGTMYASARDVTELRRKEEALYRSEQSLAITLNSIGDAVLATDARGRVTRMNSAAETLTGWPAAEATGRPIEDVFRIINEETRKRAVIPVNDVLATGETHGLANHTVLIARDGTEHSIADSAAAIRDTTGVIIGVVLVFRDVTQERVAERCMAALMKELQDVRMALDEHAIVAITDAKGSIIFANDKFCAISKYSREELLGQNHRIINSGYHPRKFFSDLWKTISHGQAWKGEIKNRAKDGSLYWVASTIFPFLGPNGKPYQYVSIRTDITATKEAEEEIRRINAELECRVAERTAEVVEREEALRSFIQNVPGAVYASAIEAPWQASFMSQAVMDVVGYAADEFLSGQIHWGNLVYPEDLPLVADAARHTMATEEAHIGEYRVIHKDGRVRWVYDVSHVAYGRDGAPWRREGNIFDITERKTLELKLAASMEQLEQLSKLSLLLSGNPAEVLDRVMEMVGDLFRIRVVALSEVVGDELSIKVMYADGRILHDAGRCPLGIMPCATVAEAKELCVFDRVQEHFPEAALLRDLNAVSYCGFPALDNNGRVVAVVCLLDDKPRTFPPNEQQLLRIIGQRVAAELEREDAINKRRAAAEHLAESERFNRATLDALSAHVAVLDANGEILATNRVWRDFAQTNAGDWHTVAEGVNYLAVCDRAAAAGDRDAALAAQKIRAIAAGQIEAWFHEYACHSPTEERWFYCRITRFPGGDPVRLAVAHENISGMKRAQAAAMRSQRRFHDLFEFAPDAIVMTDQQGVIRLANRQAEEIFGWLRADLIGQPMEILLSLPKTTARRESRSDFTPSAILSRMGADRSNLRGRRKDGAEFPVEISFSPMETEDGKMMAAAIRDITERVNAEQNARQALATLDAIDEGAFIFDPETLRFSYVNDGAVRQLGYKRDELLAMTPVDIQAEYDRARFAKFLAPPLQGEAAKHQFVTKHRHKNGHEIPVEISLRYVVGAGENSRFIAIVRDISERVKLEQQAIRSSRLEAIGNLAGGIAHDLNNALAPVMMGTDLLRALCPDEKPLIDAMEASAKRGADMVRQLLTFAKGMEGQRVSVHLEHLLRELEQIIKATFPRNIELRMHVAKGLPTVLGDATQLHQVLINLCVNARDAMPHGGTLTLEAEAVEVDSAFASSGSETSATPGGYVVFRVIDTGAGIPPNVLDHIFEPFFSTKGPEKGTGLGLSTVLGIARGHGGFVQVSSQVGRGTTVAVYLPAELIASDKEARIVAKPNFRGHGETILYVDDEPQVRDVARAILERLNFRALTAIDGADGLVQASQHMRDLRVIVTDLNMPNMDGLVFTRTLRRVLPDIPMIIASGRLDEDVAAEFKELGVRVRLDKPFTQQMFVEALQSALTGTKLSSARAGA